MLRSFFMGTYNTAVLLDSPVRYWKLDDSTGTDTQGNGNLTKGTTTAAPTTGVAGQSSIGSSWSFDGGDYASFTMPTLTTTFTFECFFKSNGATKTAHTFWRSDGADVGVVRMQGTGSVYPGQIYGVIGTAEFNTGTAYNDNAWHHLAVTVNGTAVKVYVDGVLKNDLTTGKSSYSFNSTGYLGRDMAGTAAEYLIGGLDEVAFYNTTLSQTRVQAHYNSRAGTFDGYAAEVMTGSGSSPTVVLAGPERYTTDLTTYTAGEWTYDANVTGSHADGKLTISKSTAGIGYAAWNNPLDNGGSYNALIRVKNTGTVDATLRLGATTGASATVPADGLWYWVRFWNVGTTEQRSRIWENSTTEPAGFGTSTGGLPATRDPYFGVYLGTSLIVDYISVDVLGNTVAIPTLPAENVNVAAAAATSTSAATDAVVNIWAGYSPEPFVGTGEFVSPPVSLAFTATAATATGEFPNALFSDNAEILVPVDPFTADGVMLNTAEAAAADAYYQQVLATTDDLDLWYRLDEASGTVASDARGDTAKDADIIGTVSKNVFGPESRRAFNFTGDGYLKRRWAQEYSDTQGQSRWDDSDTVDFTYEVVIRTTQKDGLLAYGIDKANPTNPLGSTPRFRSAITLKNGRVSLLWNYADRTDSVFEWSGIKDIADGEWHHVVLALNGGDEFSLQNGLRLYIDGKLDRRTARRTGAAIPDMFAVPDTLFGMPTDWRTADGTYDYPFPVNFIGDAMEVVFRRDAGIGSNTVNSLFYAAFGIVPIVATPATATGSMPDAVGRGNRKRVLVLFTKRSGGGLDQSKRIGFEINSASGLNPTVPDEFDHFIDIGRIPEPGEEPLDIAGFRVTAVPIMHEDSWVVESGENSVLPYRDPVTDLPRLLNLQVDLDLAEYDLIMFRNWPDEGAEQQVWWNRGYTNDAIEDFLASVRQAVIDGIALEVTNPNLASRLGLISGAAPIPTMYEKTGGATEKDGRSVVVNPWHPGGDSEGRIYLDTHANNIHRVVASVDGLTDIAGTEYMTDLWLTHNDGTNGEVNNKWAYKLTAGPLTIGTEIQDRVQFYNKIWTYVQEWTQYGIPQWNNYVWAITPDGLNVGTPLYKFADAIYKGAVAVDNQYKDYIGGAVVQPGDIWDGQTVNGRVFINLAENPMFALNMGVLNRQIVPPNSEILNPEFQETDEMREWDYSYNRVTTISTQAGGVDQGAGGVVIVVNPDGSATISQKNSGSLVGIGEYERYTTEPVIVPTWAIRGLAWLASVETAPIGSNTVRADAATAEGSMPDAVVTVERHNTYIATAALGRGIAVNPVGVVDPDVTIEVFPAEGYGLMTGYGKNIYVEPFVGSGEIVDNFDSLADIGEQVVVYLFNDNEVNLYLLEDM